MNLPKAKILLDKINALYKNMSADSKGISTIEKDLMRSYVQQLYESFLDLPTAHSDNSVEVIRSTPKIVLHKPEPAPTPTPERPVRRPEPPKVEAPPVVKPAPPKVETPPPPPPKVEEPAPAPPKVETPAPAPPKPPEPTPAPTPVPPVPIPLPSANDADLEELFAFSTAKELSEKLGESAIADIKKAMGLNERIFTMNELFGGDQAVFDQTLSILNGFSNFDQAKNHLIHTVASKYDWTAKGKQSKAKTFIKLVKRRYA